MGRGKVLPLTRRGWGVLALAVSAYAVGVALGYPLFRALGGIAAGVLLAAVLMTVRRPRVEVRRELYPDRVERGRPALAGLHVRNTGSRAQPALTAHDLTGDSAAAAERVAIRRLPPGAEATYRYELPTGRRGLLRVGPLVLERTDPLGLARRRVTAGGTTTLRVHPRRHPARPAVAGRPRHHHEGGTTDDSLRGSADLRDVRPYVLGDEVRHLHWKATARTGRLMVRDYVDPDQPSLGILLDNRAASLNVVAFEEAVEVVASLGPAAVLAGHRCRFLTPYGVDLVVPTGPTGARLLLDTLTELEQSAAEAPLLPPLPVASRVGGGAFVVVTGPGTASGDLAPLVRRYRRLTVVMIGREAGEGDTSTPGGLAADHVRTLVARDAATAIAQWNVGT